MGLIQKIKKRIYKAIFNLDRKTAFYAMRAVYFEGAVRRLNESNQFSWSDFTLTRQPKRFEDLSQLFFCSPLSRGILRQDIDEAAILFKYVSSLSRPVGIEIGRFYGGSTVLLATAIGAEGKLISMDIAPKNNDVELRKILEKLQMTERVELIINDANKVEINHELDFAFIDGDHSYEGARLDHNRWGSKLKTGGLLIHHDMGNTRPYAVQWNDLALLYQAIQVTQSACLEVVAEAGSMVIFKRTHAPWVNVPANNKRLVNVEGNQTRSNSYLNREDR
jgi:hypothetical protein